jgi:hypothetical protein
LFVPRCAPVMRTPDAAAVATSGAAWVATAWTAEAALVAKT